jgi:hypothetical protein
MGAIDYQKVFNNLCHIKALSHDNKFDEIVQHIILNVLYQCKDKVIATSDDIVVKIAELYGITIRAAVILSNTDKLLDAGKIQKSTQGGISLSVPVAEALKANIEKSQRLETKIKTDWLTDLKSTFIDQTDDELEFLWRGLQLYLTQIFEQHGVQTLNLLNPQNKSNEIETSSSIIVDQIVEKIGGFVTIPILTESINSFFGSADSERVNYLVQLADATFTSYALTSDKQTVEFLNGGYNDLDLFLDTNFIFGVLDLHKNTEDTAAKEIIEETKRNRLPFRLRYHPETLDEFTRAFDAKANLIKGVSWTRETSRLALMVNELSPIEKLYHETNVNQEIDPRIFLEKYDHIGKILKDLGLSEYPSFTNIRRDDDELADIESDIQSYDDFYNKNPHRRQKQKSYAKFKHDIVVLRDVRDLNPKKTKFLDSRAFFVSSDYVLSRYEKIKYVKRFEIEFVISPSVFLQLIRPFIVSNHASDKRFVDTFTIPEFRAFDIDYSSTKSKALQIINDQFHGATFKTKAQILRDRVLIEKMEQSRDDHEKQVDIIESFVAQQNAVLTEQNVTYDIREKLLTEELQRAKDELARKTKEQEYQKELTQWDTDKNTFITDRLKERKRQYRKDSRYMVKTFWWTLVVVVVAPIVLKADITHLPKLARIIITAVSYLAVFIFFCWRVFWVKDKDKERIRNGFKWSRTLGIKKYRTAILNVYGSELEEEYKTENPKPIMFS